MKSRLLLAAFALALVAPLAQAQASQASTVLPGTAPVAPDDLLYRELGGQQAIQAFTNDFYDRMLQDARIARYFDGINMKHLKGVLADYFCVVAGGPCVYDGRGHEGFACPPRHRPCRLQRAGREPAAGDGRRRRAFRGAEPAAGAHGPSSTARSSRSDAPEPPRPPPRRRLPEQRRRLPAEVAGRRVALALERHPPGPAAAAAGRHSRAAGRPWLHPRQCRHGPAARRHLGRPRHGAGPARQAECADRSGVLRARVAVVVHGPEARAAARRGAARTACHRRRARLPQPLRPPRPALLPGVGCAARRRPALRRAAGAEGLVPGPRHRACRRVGLVAVARGGRHGDRPRARPALVGARAERPHEDAVGRPSRSSRPTASCSSRATPAIHATSPPSASASRSDKRTAASTSR